MKGPDVEVERYFCNACQQTTRHVRRTVYTKRYSSEDGEWAEATWSAWECAGCEEVLLTESWISIDDVDPNTGEIEPIVSFYPPRSSHQAKKKAYESIPEHLDCIYGEVIQTFNAEAHILCAAGLRALLEAICVDKDPSLASHRIGLQKKIATLKSSVPDKIVQNLHGFRFLGNKALHELERPQPKELALAIEVMEDILNVVYELDYKSGRLYRLVSSNKKTPVQEF